MFDWLNTLKDLASFIGNFFSKIFNGIVDFFNFIGSLISFLINGIKILPTQYQAIFLIVLTIGSFVLVWRLLKWYQIYLNIL